VQACATNGCRGGNVADGCAGIGGQDPRRCFEYCLFSDSMAP
jgi:hypothetical protein